jgi:cyanoexosortase A
MLHITVVGTTQKNPDFLVLTILVWLGAWICADDEIQQLRVNPTNAGALVGIIILVSSLFRASVVIGRDMTISILAPLMVVGLALLVNPPRFAMHQFGKAILSISCLPLAVLITRFIPELALSQVTALSSGMLLQAVGFDAYIEGRVLTLSKGSVVVANTCNGVSILTMTIIVSFIFTLAFPLVRRRDILEVTLIAPILGFLSNVVRVSLLALIIGESVPWRDSLFDFFHESMGSLLFAGVAIAAFGKFYLFLIDKQLERSL